ncbi:hypothetical protein ACEUZ9_004711, partial [Paracoccus litorisediminis]|uniref:hypothetical protein n=1 Tax=Paracoccus litorisediminis TaxID=2006130 RepID=UPI003730B61E
RWRVSRNLRIKNSGSTRFQPGEDVTADHHRSMGGTMGRELALVRAGFLPGAVGVVRVSRASHGILLPN